MTLVSLNTVITDCWTELLFSLARDFTIALLIRVFTNKQTNKKSSNTSKSSCGKPQEAYRPLHNLSKHILSQGGGVPTLGGGTYLGWGVPILAREVNTLAGGYLPWQGVPTLGGIG